MKTRSQLLIIHTAILSPPSTMIISPVKSTVRFELKNSESRVRSGDSGAVQYFLCMIEMIIYTLVGITVSFK